ncbi:MAG TPA: hypothetical protein VLS28_01840, partial [Candidatus Sulfomarinibacteraceae bacterium]|nr:hypothetical protein [Candidatus Sulfomarinibacteraceae bacterium]
MKTQALRAHPTATRATRVAAASLIALAALGAAGGATLAAKGGSSAGAIWTTSESCQDPAEQDQNLYTTADQVYIRGANFDPSTPLAWSVAGQPGGASGDPSTVVASGSGSADANGAFCIDAYVILADDWGVYTVDVVQGRVQKNDNYHVEPADETPADETPADE